MGRKETKGKPKKWRRRIRRVLFLVTLALILTTASVPPESTFDLRLSPFVADRRFDWVGWETNAVLEEADWWLRGRPIPGQKESPDVLLDGAEQVRAFLDRQQMIAELEGRIRTEMARLPQSGSSSLEQSPILPDSADPKTAPRGLSNPRSGLDLAIQAEQNRIYRASVTPLEDELEELRRQQEATAPQVQRIVAAQVGQILADEGLSRSNRGWPPVTFRLNELPTYLVISPRHEIRNYRGVYLLPDVPQAERAELEAAIEDELDVSALVVDVGGVGSWPTLVIDNTSLRSLLDIVAHEWTHTYLLLRPLGLRYDDSRDLTTMNETVASIVGGEVGDRALARYYPELAPPPAPAPEPPPEANEPTKVDDSGGEDFNQAMRRIRLRVDELLAEGRVAEAEAYMEVERQKLVEAGYNLRRLNQAYFAFHGSYATSPASVDPIGPWMRQLRAQSGSLKAFLDQVSQMRSLDDLLDALEE